jgi:hypothetical protein
MESRRLLAGLLVVLAAGLALNSLLGPLAFEVIRYRWSETINNQGIGLDAVSLIIVAPLCLLAALLVRRGHAAGSALALGPASFALYMIPQYVIGPEYVVTGGNNERFFPLHFGLFIIAAAVFLLAWRSLAPRDLPELPNGRRRAAAAFLLAFPLFLVFGLYLANFIDALSAHPSRKEYLDNPTAFWVIAFLDLAVAAPAAAASGWGLLRGQEWARKGLYAMVGWFALVPPSVAAMGVVMVARDDPNGSVGRTIAFVVFAIVFASFALWLYSPVFHAVRPTRGRPVPPADGRRATRAV